MKYTTQLLGSVVAASTLLLVSCGDGSTTTDTPDTPAETPEAVAKAPYPLDVCVVSGEKLGSMGEPYVITHEGTEVRFCCDKCLPEFNKDPDKFVAMIKAGKAGTMKHSGHGN